jgi:hypothetical protein
MIARFTGRGTPLTDADVNAAITALVCDAASLWALVAVETSGFGYLADRRPQILFERHIFHGRTKGRYSAAHPDISNPHPGGYAGGPAEYDRLYRAIALDETAALESASWGLGQIMGYQARPLGYGSVITMVAAMVDTEAAQLGALVRFITRNEPLSHAFRAKSWPLVAELYNGPDYARHHYDARLAHYHALYAAGPDLPDIDLRTAQACLTYLGFPTHGIDGLPGIATRVALLTYREARRMVPGGFDAAVLFKLRAEAGFTATA